MATQEKLSARIDLAAWVKGMRGIFDTAPIGNGAVALLEVLNLQLGQSASYVGDLTGDVFIQRGLGSWQDDHAAVSARLSWMVTKLQSIVSSADPYEVKLVAIFNYIAQPILNGVYPADMVAELPAIGKRGIVVMTDGRGKSFGDAVASASLWNQAAVAGDMDRKLGNTWVQDALRSVFTQAAIQLQRSAPGEPTTSADVTVAALEAAAAAPRRFVEAIAGKNVWLYAGGAAVVALYLLFRE